MLINLLPDFFAVLESTDRLAAYQRYFDNHRRILQPYWQNYVIDPETPHFVDIVRSTIDAGHDDVAAMLDRTDVVSLARATEQQCRQILEMDCDVDVVLMVGVGAANAGGWGCEGGWQALHMPYDLPPGRRAAGRIVGCSIWAESGAESWCRRPMNRSA